MPYQWSETSPKTLRLWPHNSLNNKVFVTFIAATAALIAMPLIALLGSPVLWVMLPFLLAALAAIWFALGRNARDRRLEEVVTITPDLLTLSQIRPGYQPLNWEVNPYWLKVKLQESGGPVEQYLTLHVSGARDVELGRFLSPEERVQLARELKSALAQLR